MVLLEWLASKKRIIYFPCFTPLIFFIDIHTNQAALDLFLVVVAGLVTL